jgi:hypothetical protein
MQSNNGLESRELRCGNLVTIDNEMSWAELKGIPMRVTGIELEEDQIFPDSDGSVYLVSLDGKDRHSQMSEFIKPIALTEEWLLKFGFKPQTERNLDFNFPNQSDHILSRNGDDGWYYGFECYQVHLPPIYIHYVHQLQNLYFSLTGSELTIKG